MSLEVFGDGGDVDDLAEEAARYGYTLRNDVIWWNEADDTDGDTEKSDQEMWDYIWDRRSEEE
jgi:hypothetical protein